MSITQNLKNWWLAGRKGEEEYFRQAVWIFVDTGA
jgi:hypothetical protein